MIETRPQPSRVRSLDGLRGVAALVVVFTHAFSLVPSLGAVAFLNGPAAPTGSPLWFMVHTPIHLLWSGAAAVVVFFVLSGVVLTIPLTKPGFNWIAYYPHRILRLYLPIAIAVLLGYALILMIPRDVATDNSWLELLPKEVSKSGLLTDLTLVNGTTGAISTLWSLRYEVLFSLALPLYAAVGLAWRGHLALKIAVIVVMISAGGAFGQPMVTYLPMFLLGVVLVIERETASEWGRKIRESRHASAWWAAVFSIALLLLMSWWIVVLLSPPPGTFGAMYGPIALGSTMLVFTAKEWPALQRALSTAPILWLGTVSFSLYLVHEPIVVGTRYLFGGGWVVLEIISSVAVSLIVAQIFYKLVEGPSHRLSRAVQRRFARESASLTEDGDQAGIDARRSR